MIEAGLLRAFKCALKPPWTHASSGKNLQYSAGGYHDVAICTAAKMVQFNLLSSRKWGLSVFSG